MPDTPQFDRAAEDVGNVHLLEHVNLTVPDQGLAALFYVTGLGFTRDPYIDFGTYNMWVNAGDQQFHLPRNTAQRLRGHVGVVLPNLDDLEKRLKFVSKPLAQTDFAWQRHADHVEVTCPWGNCIRAFQPASFPNMDLGMPYIELQVPAGTAPGIQRFYEQILGCPACYEAEAARVSVQMGHNQALIFAETNEELPAYDGHHIAVYVADFSGPHARLHERGLITEESDRTQYRFQAIFDPNDGQLLTELEHEVRSLSHAMYRRPLVNRNPATNFFTYRRGNEAFSTA